MVLLLLAIRLQIFSRMTQKQRALLCSRNTDVEGAHSLPKIAFCHFSLLQFTECARSAVCVSVCKHHLHLYMIEVPVYVTH